MRTETDTLYLHAPHSVPICIALTLHISILVPLMVRSYLHLSSSVGTT